MTWFVTYRTAAGDSVRNTATEGEAVAIARGLLAGGIDVRSIGSDQLGGDGAPVGAEELRRLYGRAGA
jgi:hypothetical protein